MTVHFVDDFIRRCGLHTSLEEVGVKEEHIEALSDQAWLDPCHQTNPVPVSREDLKELFLKAQTFHRTFISTNNLIPSGEKKCCY